MSRVSSLLLACACALLCCSGLVRGADFLSLTATYELMTDPGVPRTLDNGGTTINYIDQVTFTVTLNGVTAPDPAGETITMTCTDSAGTTAGSFSSGSQPVTGSSFTIPAFDSSATVKFMGNSGMVQPLRCTAIGNDAYTTRSDEFIYYNGARWTATVAGSPIAAGEQTTLTAEIFPSDAIVLSGGTAADFDINCEGLDVIDVSVPVRRLLATSGPKSVSSGMSSTSWTITGPAPPQANFTCTVTRSGGLGATSMQESAVVYMDLPTVSWNVNWPSVVIIGEPVDLTLTLSRSCSGDLSLQGYCQSGSDVQTEFLLPDMAFLNEQTKTFTLPAGTFITPMIDVHCRIYYDFGDQYFQYLGMPWLPTNGFTIVAAGSTGVASDSTGDDQSDSTGSQQQSESSTASQQQSVSSSASQQSVSSSASVATSSGPIGGASSSTGAPCVPGLTCAAASAHASWAILALAAAAVFGALSQ